MSRVFILGSEWLYFKMYSGYKTADIILVEYLKKKIELLESINYIKKWFFIRYNDFDSHIRIRFQVNNTENISLVIKEFSTVFEDLLDKNFVWKIQSDTYLREIERYGLKTIEDSESLFYFDSKMTLDYLSLKKNFDKEETQLLFSFLTINSFLDAFSLSISEKLALLDAMQQSFKIEFNATKVLKSELDKHYREFEKEISNCMNDVSSQKLLPLYKIIEDNSENIEPVVESIKENLEINLNSFLSSHIHMMINRQFTSRQREYETLIYDHLFRYYKTCFYKKVDVLSYEVDSADL